MKKHRNIPIFIPHIGCPNACVFCNQRKISGRQSFDITRVRDELDTAFATVEGNAPVQIAYFGGSFTGIDREDMIALLAIASEYIDAGKCESVRISTRPDYITAEILDILRAYRVGTIELVKEYGFELIGQMMVGLPTATAESEIETARAIVRMGADGARIYPAVVFEDTALAEMTRSGSYEPLTTETSAVRAAAVLGVFLEQNIPVIRIGLQSGESLVSGDGVLAGGYHPAVGEMAYALYFRALLEKELRTLDARGKHLLVFVHPADVSKTIGQRGANKEYLITRYGLTGLKVVPDGNIMKNTVRIHISDLK